MAYFKQEPRVWTPARVALLRKLWPSYTYIDVIVQQLNDAPGGGEPVTAFKCRHRAWRLRIKRPPNYGTVSAARRRFPRGAPDSPAALAFIRVGRKLAIREQSERQRRKKQVVVDATRAALRRETAIMRETAINPISMGKPPSRSFSTIAIGQTVKKG